MQDIKNIELHINTQAGKKVFFAGDFHLGMPNETESLAREKRICAWLRSIADEAQHIFLMGDLFDVWLEYKHSVPKGYTRFLGCLAELRDQGIPITVFSGNHDLWMYGYFEKEFSIKVYHEPIRIKIDDQVIILGHGDGIWKGEKKYRILKSVLRNKICQGLYKWLHPDLGIPLARYFSKRGHSNKEDNLSKGDDKEYIIQFCKAHSAHHPEVNYYIFGHRHLTNDYEVKKSTRYINTGDWISYNSYVEFESGRAELKHYH